jgi:hypothetical protein
MCDPEDRAASETGLSEQALRQLMKEAFLLEMEQKCQLGEAMLSGKVGDSAMEPVTGSDRGGAPPVVNHSSTARQ